MKITYDIEADWVLLRSCNFRCLYCAIPPEELGGRITVFGTAAQWSKAFDATGKSWLLHMTGGEPSVYPGFVDLCEQLARNHYLSINTNLTTACWEQFRERVDPARVHYINAALHYDERQKKHSLECFVERAHRLVADGFNVLVSVVMTPEVTKIFSELELLFEPHDLAIIPKVMRGLYGGKLYPEAYTENERCKIRDHLKDARSKYAPVIARMSEPPTINMFADERFLERIPDYRGKLCASGSRFVQIQPDGDIIRCGSAERLGNILRNDIRILSSPRRCNTSYCPYFCEKYTAPPFVPLQNHLENTLIDTVSRFRRRVARSHLF